MMKAIALQIALAALTLHLHQVESVSAFSAPSLHHVTSAYATRQSSTVTFSRGTEENHFRNAGVGSFSNAHDDCSSVADKASEEAARLLARAKRIRDSIPVAEDTSNDASVDTTKSAHPSVGYRIYVDIGRESGTWMDPRWGASGKRIEFTLDVEFLTPNADGTSGVDTSLANEKVVARMVKDNFGGKSSPVRVVSSSRNARLRGGFDKMACHGGGYRIDVGGGNRQSVARFFVDTEGTPETGSSYGDIFVPKGPLYFSIPCFGTGVTNLSTKESPVTVRQIGWHTGWRREESRIVGTFKAKKIDEARIADKY